MNNPNCDGNGPHSREAENRPCQTRRLPTGGDGAAILCRKCYHREIAWRKERNRDLEPQNHFDLPAWDSLPVYTGA